MASKKVKKGEIILKEGNFSDCVYIIESGVIEIVEKNAEGQEIVIGVLGESDIFCEMGLINGLPRSATARALEDSEVHVLTKETFDSLTKQNPDALMPILKVLAHRLRETLALMKAGYKMPGAERRSKITPANHLENGAGNLCNPELIY